MPVKKDKNDTKKMPNLEKPKIYHEIMDMKKQKE